MLKLGSYCVFVHLLVHFFDCDDDEIYYIAFFLGRGAGGRAQERREQITKEPKQTKTNDGQSEITKEGTKERQKAHEHDTAEMNV